MKASMNQAKKKKINHLLRESKGKPTTKDQREARKEANQALYLMGRTPTSRRGEIEETVVSAAKNLEKAFEKKD